MHDIVSELSSRAQALPPEDRARLAEALLASLDPQDPTIENAWDAELQRRINDIECGSVELIAADQVFAEVRRALQQ